MHRGGRIGRARHLIGSALQTKPILHIGNGLVTALESVRTRKRALNRLVELAQQRTANHSIKRLAVGHGQVAEEANLVISELKSALTFDEFYQGGVGPTVGTHADPGVIGIAYEIA